jgi:hypothetical protein
VRVARIMKEMMEIMVPMMRIQMTQTLVMFRLKSYQGSKSQSSKEDAVISMMVEDVSGVSLFVLFARKESIHLWNLVSINIYFFSKKD